MILTLELNVLINVIKVKQDKVVTLSSWTVH